MKEIAEIQSFKIGVCCTHTPCSVYQEENLIRCPGVSFILSCFVVYSTRRFVVCLSVFHFVLVFFSPFSIAITSLVEERELILVLFVRLFDLCLFGFVGFLFLLGSGKGCVL